MGLLPSLFGGKAPLRPNGHAPFSQPSDRDRRALFWWLKRNTSVTAIEHNANLWTAFAKEWEKWLRSQDDPPEEDVTSYKYIVNDQLNYERGLQSLRRGDRSVWLRRSSEGWLGKINTGLIQRRLELTPAEEHIQHLASYGVPLSLLRAYYAAHDAAMAVGHEIAYSALDRPRRAGARPLLAYLPFDTSLPEPRWDISFKPGASAPKDGIYEQVDAQGNIVGGMAYFVKSEKAEGETGLEFGPQSWDVTQKATSDFLWRLLWEDTRYKDGKIPDEERHYQTPSESVAIEHAVRDGAKVAPQNLRCEANHPCPKTGFWFTPARAGSRQRFEAGQVMPEVGGDYGATIWQWDDEQG
ncbi:hypothetical protein KGA65_01050 [Ideonella sp. B7]|uniref:Imm72 family immunity protein n=1 Tax=Ideonella benzenivorans TaxID=2831643 RepID=UPI001CED4F15|nr:Imm72 family immunity protein [Ideonella benzenivorans]MCA6215115.1 hypothetical protein [Ideonella benzenivorans]